MIVRPTKRRKKKMLRNTLSVSRSLVCKIQKRYSALFVNGQKATETYVFVHPHIDMPEQLKDKESLQAQLAKRKADINLEKLENLWTVYEELRKQINHNESKKSEISMELGKIVKQEPDGEKAMKYKMQINLLKDNIKKLKRPLWSAEENAIVESLKLPNSVHSLTPEKDSCTLYSHLIAPNNSKDHLTIAKVLDLINFKKNENYYLKGDAAIFELGAKFYISDILKKHKFIQFSNPDFVKSVIVEGCGEDHTNSNSTFILHHNEDTKINVDSRLHLTGGGSLFSFMAYHGKNVIYPKNFPLKYFSMGRQYIPVVAHEDSLFHVSQSSVIQVFDAAKDADQLEIVLAETIGILKMIYINLGYHFRMSFVPASKLLMWESLRLSIEMYSTSLKSYVEVGNLSVSGDFISKRLMFTYSDKKDKKFPHIVSGTILNVPRLLGCVLEQDEAFTVPKCFQVKNWSL